MRGLLSRGYNLMVDLLIYKPFYSFTPPTPTALCINSPSLSNFCLMPLPIRYGKAAGNKSKLSLSFSNKTLSLFIWFGIVMEGTKSLLMLLSYIASNSISCSESQPHSVEIHNQLADALSRGLVKFFYFLQGIVEAFVYCLLDPYVQLYSLCLFLLLCLISLFIKLWLQSFFKLVFLSLSYDMMWKQHVLLINMLVSIQQRPNYDWTILIL